MQMSTLDRARALAESKTGISAQQHGMRRILSIMSTDDDSAEKFVRIARVIRDLDTDAQADAVLAWIENASPAPIV
jgi:hypothetical protein